MNDNEFTEYKEIIKGALDLVGFDGRIDVQRQNITGIEDVIVVSSTRSIATVALIPAGHVFHVGYMQNNHWTTKEIDLAAPDSLQTFGAIVKRILGPSWTTQK